MRQNPPSRVLSVVLSCAIGLVVACQAAAPDGQMEPHMIGGTDVERGRYLAIIGGCNDCHTDGYLQAEGDVPEDRWLLGSPVGWRGPWGTTYPPNLRLSVGFYPARADTSEKAHLGPGGVSWQSEGSTARSLNVRRSG